MPDAPATDVLGTPLTQAEQALLAAYEQLKALLALDLPPCAEANVKDAIACLWNAVNDLALTDDRPAL
jgi:hypothetical protein